MSIENPVVNDYVIEMPDLISHLPTADEVKAISSAKVGSVTPEFTSDWDGQTWYLITDNEKCENVIGKFNSSHLVAYPEVWLCEKVSDKWIRPHIDTERLSVLIYPIVPTSYDIQFVDKWEDDLALFTRSYENTVSYSYNTVHTHTYTCPTLINAKVPHCLPSTAAKTTLQISMYFGGSASDWANIKSLYQAGNLVTI